MKTVLGRGKLLVVLNVCLVGGALQQRPEAAESAAYHSSEAFRYKFLSSTILWFLHLSKKMDFKVGLDLNAIIVQ
jgi:hypothetical protein